MKRAKDTPRVVVVTRRSEYEELLRRHGTRGQAKFFRETRELAIEPLEARHRKLEEAKGEVAAAIPRGWRRARVERDDLSRFVFEPSDVLVAVGQDGLVANVAKYLDGQSVIGINPDPEAFDGILVPHPPERAAPLLAACGTGRQEVERRTMVEALLDDGQRLLAVNEIFVGSRSHQSARYRIHWGESEERHSSSGVIITTGTGATGWARSIERQRQIGFELPRPEDPRLAFFVREPFPSVTTGCQLEHGLLGEGETLALYSEMGQGGVIFGDGIEDDRLDFRWGLRSQIRRARQTLDLVRE